MTHEDAQQIIELLGGIKEAVGTMHWLITIGIAFLLIKK